VVWVGRDTVRICNVVQGELKLMRVSLVAVEDDWLLSDYDSKSVCSVKSRREKEDVDDLYSNNYSRMGLTKGLFDYLKNCCGNCTFL